MRSRATQWRLVAALGLTAGAAFCASEPWTRAYPAGEAAPLLAGASACSVAIPALVVRLARARAWWSMSASAVAFLAFTLLAVLGGPGALAALGHGLTDGLARLLSESLPVSSSRSVLVPALVATWCTGATCGELIARGRSATAVVGVLAAAFVLAEAITAAAPGQPVGWAIALTVLAAALLALAPRRGEGELLVVADTGGRRRRPPIGVIAFGLGALAAASAAGTAVAPSLPGIRSTPASLARPAPVRASEPLTPTAAVVDLRDGPVHTLFQVHLSAPTTGYLAVAELDAYDGSSWSFDQLFTPTGGRVPPPPGVTAAPGTRVVQHVRLQHALGMPWMPYLDRPVEVDGIPIVADASSGMVMPAYPLSAGSTFSVVSDAQPRAELGTLSAAGLAAGPEAPPENPEDLAVPPAETKELSGFVSQLRETSHVGTDEPLAFLRAVEADLAAHDRTVPPSRGAHHRPAPADTTFADAVHAVVVARRATPEQYATFFALLARHLGVPARVVTGFRLPGATDGRGTRARATFEVTSAQAWTWTELEVAGLGWVVADPSPARTGAAPLPSSSASPTATSTTLPAAQAVPRPAPSGHAVAPKVAVHLSGGSGLLVPALAGGAGLLVAAWLALLAARARRRRLRRTRGAPAARVAAAWLETLDTLEDAALGPLDPLTAHEVVEAASARFGPGASPHLEHVAERANVALYSSDPHRLDEAEALQAWAHLDDLRREVRRALPLSLRLRAALAPGLRRRAGPTP